MSDFKITVGMSTQGILQNLNSLQNLSDKSKQLIINFCNNDKDKRVTNEIELAMLDSYVNNQEKVSMPKPVGLRDITGTKEAKKYSSIGSLASQKTYKTSNNRALCFSENGLFVYNSSLGCTKLDIFADFDKDGFADYRLTSDSSDNEGISYYDDNLDGVYDRKFTQKELNVAGYESVEINTETDLKANAIKSKIKVSERTIEDKNGKGETTIFAEEDMLTGKVKTTKIHIDYATGESTEINE